MSVQTIYIVMVNGKPVAAYHSQPGANGEAKEQGGTVQPVHLFSGVRL
ncbi:hypothetical protein [Arsukibacterium indicum]|uniref:Uncharacterized protein n=1 Tax=Arsukibacterium indicum TaxID=2848612 RepID=A0ABS6MHD3_9GAMM|nr:hypothetical protein [Arsukibacterium indicum]MBV2128198.1 hypothetical protein [Arsukibacterium indicum]